jgi:phosphoserine aminotransferase
MHLTLRRHIMERVYNFSAGPSVLPESVLLKAQAELPVYKNTGMSVMEMSHRSKMFISIFDDAERLLRELMGIPANYKVLFLQGGASLQFSMVPMNLMQGSKKADYVHTGEWSGKAMKEAKKVGEVNMVASSEDKKFTYIPELDPSKFNKDADYFHITSNNTIYGTKFSKFPNTGSVPLVCDMSSNILSEVIDMTQFGIIYAGAQKNIAPAGLTIAIVREDLIGKAPDSTPTMMNYKTHADAASMFNTPPCYSIYIAKLVFEWLKDLGGIPAIEKINKQKAAILYDYLDESKLFKGNVEVKDRSLMNITFATGDKEIDDRFVKESEARGFDNLKGYRTVGGMRASCYNAMPIEGVAELVKFMKEFEVKNV